MIHYVSDKYGGTESMDHPGNNMKFTEKLAALPVRYFCNYCLLGCLGIAFEALVFWIRAGKFVDPYIQALAVAAFFVAIQQTAAEYFIPSGSGGFFLRLGAALVHQIFFSGLVLLQVDLEMPLFLTCGLLGQYFLALVFCQIRFPGKIKFIFLPSLFCVIFLLIPVLTGALGGLLSPGLLITGNIILFLMSYSAWSNRSGNNPKKD